MDEGEDDDVPVLSKEALAALTEFYAEQQEPEEGQDKGDWHRTFKEDWQLSQFWYDEETVDRLSTEVSTAVGETGRIALISCPTLYSEVKRKCPRGEVKLFEFDERFAVFGDDYSFYNYETPLEVSQSFASYFDLVVADPPFLSEDCLTKTAITVRFLSNSKIILCTGAVMGRLAERLLNVKPTSFNPRHKNNLSNEFLCYTNYNDQFSKT